MSAKARVTSAVIPVAGLGTRMLPATKAIPKEMLPIVDMPLIQYIVNEAVEAGIRNIILVTHSSKNSIENHFDTSFELEATLEKRVKRQLLFEVQNTIPKDVTIMHVRQGIAKGLGHAVLCAHPLVGDNPFAVLLPDVLIDDALSNPKKDNLAEMKRRFEDSGTGQIMVEKVPHDEVSSYGIVDIGGRSMEDGVSVPIQSIVEKPHEDEAPSDYAVVGRYILPKEIWHLLKETPPGAGDEIQLTDSIALLMREKEVDAYEIKGQSHDCGNKLGYMETNMLYAARNPKFGESFRNLVKRFAETL